jgi:hypothetical protein
MSAWSLLHCCIGLHPASALLASQTESSLISSAQASACMAAMLLCHKSSRPFSNAETSHCLATMQVTESLFTQPRPQKY